MTVMGQERDTETPPARHLAPGRRRRWIARAAIAAALLVTLGMIAYTVPVPILEGFVRDQIVAQVSGQVSCPGAAAVRTEVTVGGGPLVPQAVRRRLSEVRLSVPDATLNGVPHARFDATM